MPTSLKLDPKFLLAPVVQNAKRSKLVLMLGSDPNQVEEMNRLYQAALEKSQFLDNRAMVVGTFGAEQYQAKLAFKDYIMQLTLQERMQHMLSWFKSLTRTSVVADEGEQPQLSLVPKPEKGAWGDDDYLVLELKQDGMLTDDSCRRVEALIKERIKPGAASKGVLALSEWLLSGPIDELNVFHPQPKVQPGGKSLFERLDLQAQCTYARSLACHAGVSDQIDRHMAEHHHQQQLGPLFGLMLLAIDVMRQAPVLRPNMADKPGLPESLLQQQSVQAGCQRWQVLYVHVQNFQQSQQSAAPRPFSMSPNRSRGG